MFPLIHRISLVQHSGPMPGTAYDYYAQRNRQNNPYGGAPGAGAGARIPIPTSPPLTISRLKAYRCHRGHCDRGHGGDYFYYCGAGRHR